MSTAMPADSTDFSTFRSIELGEKIAEVLSLTQRARVLFRALILVTLACAGLAWLVLLADAAWLRILGMAYGGAVGVVVGAGVSVVWLAHTELRRIEELLLLILDVSARVAKARAGEDDDSRPTPAQLLPIVYRKVIAPTVTEVARKQLRLLGRPVSWVLDAILKRGVDMLAKLLERMGVGWEWFERDAKPGPAAEVGEPAEASEPAEAEGEGEGEAKAEGKAQPEAKPEPEPEAPPPSKSERARALVEQVGAKLRALLLPFWGLLVAIAMLAMSPVFALAWLAG